MRRRVAVCIPEPVRSLLAGAPRHRLRRGVAHHSSERGIAISSRIHIG
ncbi:MULTISPECIES: hypothetical protein [unclassified Nodularia (in: cyanobacteria)]|nr:MULTISPECIES: hypothetical protein [unclassified Nodularia (in: cyanobacteria)]MBE9198819.1 hypothetical protein [Nodularia sp. LEGE 06071]MCC2692973.1 hypothetical protein [Nodularia sp. LEGE 04288]